MKCSDLDLTNYTPPRSALASKGHLEEKAPTPLYRFSRSLLLPDIQQMHSYHDAIYHGERRAVWGAWLLYAGRGGLENPCIIAYPDSTLGRPFGSGAVGAILMRPGGVGNEHLQAIINRFLNGIN